MLVMVPYRHDASGLRACLHLRGSSLLRNHDVITRHICRNPACTHCSCTTLQHIFDRSEGHMNLANLLCNRGYTQSLRIDPLIPYRAQFRLRSRGVFVRGQRPAMSGAVPFTVQVSDGDLQDLQDRLKTSRYPDQLELAGWDYGTELNSVQALVAYWQDSFDWRKQEKLLNTFPQFKMDNVNGINLHFVHQRSKHPDAVPLLLLHGWPGSFFEFYKLINRLTAPEEATGDMPHQAFHVVAPSLPGFGFSSAPKRSGFGIAQMARTVSELMLRLGYDKYYAQGGDWGSTICRVLGTNHTHYCKGIHVNMAIALPKYTNPWHLLQIANLAIPGLNQIPIFISKQEMDYVRDTLQWRKDETGYQSIQGTKPQSLGYGLNDSPLGLLAWIAEKMYGWSESLGSPENIRPSRDELLTDVCIYWFTQTMPSSMRIYYEFFHLKEFEMFRSYCKAPTAVAVFPREILKAPRAWVQSAYNLRRYTTFPSGGHFAALEEPEALLGDVRAFFGELGAAGLV